MIAVVQLYWDMPTPTLCGMLPLAASDYPWKSLIKILWFLSGWEGASLVFICMFTSTVLLKIGIKIMIMFTNLTQCLEANI